MSGEGVFGGGRNLDEEQRGNRAQTPCGLIRRPLQEPSMTTIRADLTATSEDELRRRATEGDDDALAELARRAAG